MTQILTINASAPQLDLLAEAAAVIRSGGLVAFPTETVYGLGADATNAEAIERIYAAKNRPASDPIIVHIATLDQLAGVAVNLPDLALDLARSFWPGPLTLVLQRHSSIPATVSAGRDTVAVRLPSHPVAAGLIAAAERPIAAPSANTFSRPSATTAAHVLEDLGGRIDLILDGGSASIGLESTVLDLTSDPVVLRPGGVTVEQLRALIPDLQVRSQYLALDETAEAPGQLIKHYSPRAEVRLFDGDPVAVLQRMQTEARERTAEGERVGIMTIETERLTFGDIPAEVISLEADAAGMGAHLFAALREFDQRGVQVILARLPAAGGLGTAVRDRLIRAAEGRILRVD